MNAVTSNLNEARSEQTRSRLITATIDLLVEVGYSQTTGVAVCRRSGLTRGALNHHFPVYADLLIAALYRIYDMILPDAPSEDITLEERVTHGFAKVTQPEFKAVIELWLASRNDPAIGDYLGEAVEVGARLFKPANLTVPESELADYEQIHRLLTEALIGIGLGRATTPGGPPAHEPIALAGLIRLAKDFDQRLARLAAAPEES